MKKNKLVNLYKKWNKDIKKLSFSSPCFYVYNSLDYSFESIEFYLNHVNLDDCINLFFGINPGPYGMAQTGIPFGDKETVKNYLKLNFIKIDEKKSPKSTLKSQF